jgi:hypothetical protein
MTTASRAGRDRPFRLGDRFLVVPIPLSIRPSILEIVGRQSAKVGVG